MLKKLNVSNRLVSAINIVFFGLITYIALTVGILTLINASFFGEDFNEDFPFYQGFLRMLLPPVFFAAIIQFFLHFSRAICTGKFKRLDERSFNTRVLLIGVGIILVIQLVVVSFLIMNPVTDSRRLEIYAKKIVTDGSLECMNTDFNERYIVWFQNNIPTLLVYCLIYKLTYMLTGTFTRIPMVIFNTLCINLAVLFTVLTSRRIFGGRKAVITLALCAFFAPFYTYTPYFYSDTFSIPMVMGTIYTFVRATQTESRIKKALLFAASGAMCFIGFELKGSVIILFIAIIIYLPLRYGIRRAAKSAGAFVLSFVVLFASWSAVWKSVNPISEEVSDKYQFPVIHWVMMGLNYEGTFSEDDFDYTASFPTMTERVNGDADEIKRRISDYGPVGLADHVFFKMSGTYHDGTHNISHYIEFPERHTFLHDIIIKWEPYRFGFFAYSHAYHFFLFFVMGYSGLAAFKKRRKSVTALFRLVILGAMAFFVIWETNPRYLFNYTPIYLLLATEGLTESVNLKEKYLKWRASKKAA